jgi:hypothetical protein
MFTETHAKNALTQLQTTKGRERARLIEQMLRWETNHFKSKQYQLTGSAGMEQGKWANLDEENMKTIKMNDNHPAQVRVVERTFLVWNSVYDFCIYLSDYIDRHKGNYARWNSTDLNQQARYMSAINSVRPKFII